MFLNQKIDHITKSNSTWLACTRPIIIFFIVRFIVKLINNSCKILEINSCNIKKNMHTMTPISELRMENFLCNINIMFHATSTTQCKETIVTTSVLVCCGMSPSIQFYSHIGHPDPSINRSANKPNLT